jgi:hypothetical protein
VPPGYICWLRGFPGAVWAVDTDQTSGAVVCKPIDEVAALGRATYVLIRAWKIISGLPVPP